MSFPWLLDENKYLKLWEVETLRKTCEKLKQEGTKKHNFALVRNWFMVELGLFSGLRVREMSELKCGDLLLGKDQSSLVVKHGKGNKRRTVKINPEFKKECLWFLNYKQRIGQNVEENSSLFCSVSGRQLSKRAMQKAFKRCTKKAGLSENYSIHCLRHTYGTHLYKASNYNLRLVQKQLGHVSIRTTEVYANLLDDDTTQAVRNLYKT
jgi:site-specific recombinase XerD